MDPDDRVVQSVRSPVVVGLTSTVGPEELSQRGRRIPTTSFSLEHFPHCCPGAKRASSSARALSINRFKTPPLFNKSPFHRFGVRLNKKAEIVRDRRVSREEDKRLLDTALGVMNTAAHQYVGELLHDRIVWTNKTGRQLAFFSNQRFVPKHLTFQGEGAQEEAQYGRQCVLIRHTLCYTSDR